MGKTALLIAAAACLGVAACGKKEARDAKAPDAAQSPAPSTEARAEPAPEMPAGFPKMTASYKAVYQAEMEPGQMKNVAMEVSGGKKLRFEMPHFNAAKAAEGAKLIGVFDDAANRSVMYMEGPGAQNVAVVLPQQEDFFATFLNWATKEGDLPTKVGKDNIAGMNCDVWEAGGGDGEPAQQACLTRDGILLRAGEAGSKQPQMLAVSVDKGAVNAARFAVPQGFEVVDMGPCQELMQGAMASAQAGKQPDMAAMQQCQGLAMKAASVFGDVMP